MIRLTKMKRIQTDPQHCFVFLSSMTLSYIIHVLEEREEIINLDKKKSSFLVKVFIIPLQFTNSCRGTFLVKYLSRELYTPLELGKLLLGGPLDLPVLDVGDINDLRVDRPHVP